MKRLTREERARSRWLQGRPSLAASCLAINTILVRCCLSCALSARCLLYRPRHSLQQMILYSWKYLFSLIRPWCWSGLAEGEYELPDLHREGAGQQPLQPAVQLPLQQLHLVTRET